MGIRVLSEMKFGETSLIDQQTDQISHGLIPSASSSEKGGIKVGNGLSIDANGVLSSSSGSSPDFTLWTYEDHDNLTSSCTDSQVPTAKLVYNHVMDKLGDYMPYSDHVTTITLSTNDNEEYVTAPAVKTFVKSAPQTLTQGMKIVTGSAIQLEDNISIYKKALSAAVTFTISTASLVSSTNIVATHNANASCVWTFELVLVMPATVYAITFPSSVSWLNGEIPDMSTASKTYILAFRSFDNGTSWVGNLQGSY